MRGWLTLSGVFLLNGVICMVAAFLAFSSLINLLAFLDSRWSPLGGQYSLFAAAVGLAFVATGLIQARWSRHVLAVAIPSFIAAYLFLAGAATAIHFHMGGGVGDPGEIFLDSRPVVVGLVVATAAAAGWHIGQWLRAKRPRKA